MDKEKHTTTSFCGPDEIRKRIHDPLFGCVMYQLAKLRMLQFYYDFLDKYVDRSDFQYIEMDTDNAYLYCLVMNWMTSLKYT
jgi:hypothetical protein